jgi:hypothetical protein
VKFPAGGVAAGTSNSSRISEYAADLKLPCALQDAVFEQAVQGRLIF